MAEASLNGDISGSDNDLSGGYDDNNDYQQIARYEGDHASTADETCNVDDDYDDDDVDGDQSESEASLNGDISGSDNDLSGGYDDVDVSEASFSSDRQETPAAKRMRTSDMQETPAAKRMLQIVFPERVGWVLEFLATRQEEEEDANNEREGKVIFSFELHLGTSAQQQMRRPNTTPLCIKRCRKADGTMLKTNTVGRIFVTPIEIEYGVCTIRSFVDDILVSRLGLHQLANAIVVSLNSLYCI